MATYIWIQENCVTKYSFGVIGPDKIHITEEKFWLCLWPCVDELFQFEASNKCFPSIQRFLVCTIDFIIVFPLLVDHFLQSMCVR